MKPLTKDQYNYLTVDFADAMTLAKQNMVKNGIEPLIPLHEELTGVKMKENCGDCILAMMVGLARAVKIYEEANAAEATPDKKADKKTKSE